jgi:hypothetical protein
LRLDAVRLRHAACRGAATAAIRTFEAIYWNVDRHLHAAGFKSS